jgi:hypothetical protein
MSTDSESAAVPLPKPKRRKIIWSIGIITAAVLVLVVIWLMALRNPQPLPSSIRKATHYTLYYPSQLPQGYAYKKGSTRLDGGMVFYNLVNDRRTISVSLQAAPPQAIDLKSLVGFQNLDTAAGKAAVGKNGDNPTIIISTNTTLITINGSAGTPQDVVGAIAKNMASLPE